MQLDQLKLALRRRSPWEALDLGLVMLRRWRGPVYRVWLSTFAPCALLIIALLWQWPAAAVLIIWWLKPLFDRLLLKVFAEASFGTAPSVRDVWRALPGLLRHSGLLAGLTLRRFNTSRSFDLPVWQLEGQRGKDGRARLRVLGRKTSSYAFWLTFVCAHFVVIFEFGLVAMMDVFTPSDGLPSFSWAELVAGESEDWHIYAFSFAWVIAESIVEPFFIAAGFSLYLNRRSELEGWDIEVAFRRMAARQIEVASTTGLATGLTNNSGAGSTLARTTMVALLTGSLLWTLASPREASAEEAIIAPSNEQVVAQQTPAPASRPGGDIKQAVDKILADPVFGHKVEETSWRPRKQEKETAEDIPWWAKQLIKFAELLASGTRGVIYVLIFLSAVALLIVMYRYRHLAFGERKSAIKQPDTLFGLDLRPASLPDDIAGAALAELDAARYASALSLLYRGTLVALIRRQHIEFRAGDTEDVCLRRVSGRIDAQAAIYFGLLLDAWKRTAYAETPPDAASARELCLRWAQHFAGPGRAA
jgi:hypothetical protein